MTTLPPFPTAVTVEQARQIVSALCAQRRLPAESIPLAAASGRVLAVDVVAPFDVPPFANSAMDGFALRASDLSTTAATRLRIAGTRLAGAGGPDAFGPGECLRIMTGSPMPQGADSVVIKENVVVDGDVAVIAVGEHSRANIRAAGEDYARGDAALTAGVTLGPAQLGVLASFGSTSVDVVRRPRAIVLTSGDEVVSPGTMLRHGQIYNSNGVTLAALLAAIGADVVAVEHVRDDRDALRAALASAAARADIVLTSGGVSAGDADFLPQVIGEIGTVAFWKVRIKPGMPMLVGTIGAAVVFALPGNPVSGIATCLTLVRPGIDAMLARRDKAVTWHARIVEDWKKSHARAEYLRARWEPRDDGVLWVKPFARQGSGMLRGVADADCLVVVPEHVRELVAGAVVEIVPLTGLC